jgi:shikimate kinase
MDHQPPIVLTGFMSSGKTTVAAALSRRLDSTSVDLDDVITANEGRTPKELINEAGEAAFRDAETRALQCVLQSAMAGVISLGGGAWIRQVNRDLIASHEAISVWLDAPFAVCWQRIPAGGGERPLASDKFQAEKLYEERRTHYALAQVRVEIVAAESVDEIVEKIIQALSPGNT